MVSMNDNGETQGDAQKVQEEGMPAQGGTPEIDADQRNPNVPQAAPEGEGPDHPAPTAATGDAGASAPADDGA